MSERQGFVYVIKDEDTNTHKIGFSKNHPREIIRNMTRTGYESVRLLFFSIETREFLENLHGRFESKRLNRKGYLNFFSLSEEDIHFIMKAMCKYKPA